MFKHLPFWGFPRVNPRVGDRLTMGYWQPCTTLTFVWIKLNRVRVHLHNLKNPRFSRTFFILFQGHLKYKCECLTDKEHLWQLLRLFCIINTLHVGVDYLIIYLLCRILGGGVKFFLDGWTFCLGGVAPPPPQKIRLWSMGMFICS